MTDDLDWTHNAADISSAGLDRDREATETERDAIAQGLGLLKLGRLASKYRIVPIAGGAYRLSGRVSANVEQACIVTLEPVSDRIDAPFDVEFWPVLEVSGSDEDASVLAGPDVELLDRGLIPVGRIVFETFSASLDPYPRRADAEFNWQDPRAADAEKSNPFAVLSKLKDKD